MSSREFKENFATVHGADVLERVVQMPISTWNYKAQGATVRHIGPMAQDFAAAFAVGENDTTISTVDAQGVALAAIQGLDAKLEAQAREKNARFAGQQTRIETQ